jgi:hypothetical protein
VYKKGVNNRVADALSRRTNYQEEFCMVSTPTPAWLQLVQDSYSSDPAAKEILSKLAVNKDSVPNYQLNQGITIGITETSIGQKPMEDNPKPIEKGFFRRLWVIFRRPLADRSFLMKVLYFSSVPTKVL